MPKQGEPWFAESLHWTETVEWWRSPALAYAAGLRHGAQLQAAGESEERAAAVAELSRAAVRAVEVVEARRAAA